MNVRIRLRPTKGSYHIVVMDARSSRASTPLDKLGFYLHQASPKHIQINYEKLIYWLSQGAQFTDNARKVIVQTGVWEIIMQKYRK